MNKQLTLQYAVAMMGYADELETTALELTYNHGVTEHSKGNGYSQVIFCYGVQFPFKLEFVLD